MKDKKSARSFKANLKQKLKKIRTFKRNGVLFQQGLRLFWSIKFVNRCMHKFARTFFNVDDTKIVFATFSHSFTCNPGAIAEALVKRDYPGKMVFLVNKKYLKELRNSEFGRKIEFVNVWSWRALYEAATAKIRLENAQTFLWASFTPKRYEQIYINTWHGSLGIKRMDTAYVLGKRAKLSKKYTDYCISNSDFDDMILETSFFQNVPKVRLGHARNDILFQSEEAFEQIRGKCRKQLNLPDACHIALYAPTFRDKTLYKGFLTIDYQALNNALQQRFGGEWKILVKLHPHDVQRMKNAGLQLPPTVIDAADYRNINELMLATDIGITDYSSWIFDYIHLRRPGFIYAPDIEAYKRGFYYPLTDAPFPVSENEQQLCDSILNFDNDKYLSDVEAFLDKMGCIDDGKSCDRIADFIEGLVFGKKLSDIKE